MVEPAAFVCGHPIAHSRSPLIHRFWLEQHGIRGSYRSLDVPPAKFQSFVQGFGERGLAGGNVTIPHKENAFRLVARRDKAAEAIGAVNTLWFEGDDLWGGNTDARGFAANLDDQAPGWSERRVAVIVGAGGAARAVVHALLHRGFGDIRIVNRSMERAIELVDRFGTALSAHPSPSEDVLGDAGLLVNTTALGMHGEQALPADPAYLAAAAIVADIVYVPLETPLLAAARARGLQGVDGLGMLLHQAAPGFERWFGQRPEVTLALREHIIADLERAR